MADSVTQFRLLLESLGDRSFGYMNCLKRWFRMLITKEEFDAEIRKFLSAEQIRLQNQLILSVLNKCSEVSGESRNGSADERVAMSSFFYGHFEPVTSAQIEDKSRVKGCENPEVCFKGEVENREDDRLFAVNEGYLPDRAVIMSRLYYSSWERGLDGPAGTGVADLLVIATQNLVKNLVTAIVSRRKGGKFGPCRLLHSVNKPVANPWLRNVQMKLKRDRDDEDWMCHWSKKSKEELIRNEAFFHASNVSPDSLQPISLFDVFITLMVYPNVIASDYIYTITKERIITKLEHPTYDD